MPPSLKIVLAAEHAKLFNQQDLKILPLHGKILQDLKLPPMNKQKKYRFQLSKVQSG